MNAQRRFVHVLLMFLFLGGVAFGYQGSNDDDFVLPEAANKNCQSKRWVSKYNFRTGQSFIYRSSWGLASGASRIYYSDFAFASGRSNVYNSDYGISVGFSSLYNAHYSLALGYSEVEDGCANYLMGYGLRSFAQHGVTILGNYNDYLDEPEHFDFDDPDGDLFVLGNGVDDNNRSNAIIVKKSGNTTIYGDLVVDGSFSARNISDGVAQFDSVDVGEISSNTGSLIINSNVGIGGVPSKKLHVYGEVKANGFIGDGSQLTNLSGIITSAERAKLVAIEEGATGDLTALEIKGLYESNPDTNAFSDQLLSEVLSNTSKLELVSVTQDVDLDVLEESVALQNTLILGNSSSIDSANALISDNRTAIGLNTENVNNLSVSLVQNTDAINQNTAVIATNMSSTIVNANGIQANSASIDNLTTLQQSNTDAITNIQNQKISELADDLSPQLGGDLDVNGYSITSSIVDGDILIDPNGEGRVGIGVDVPDETLEVDGNVKASAFIGDGSSLTNLPEPLSTEQRLILSQFSIEDGRLLLVQRQGDIPMFGESN